MNNAAFYRKYMQGKGWDDKRRHRLKKAKYRCECCGKENCVLAVHHLTYKNLGREKDKDLQVVCSECHEWRHEEQLQIKNHMKAIMQEA